MLEIQLLARNRHAKMARLNRLMGLLLFNPNNGISNSNTFIKKTIKKNWTNSLPVKKDVILSLK
jgi:hypothetical protein